VADRSRAHVVSIVVDGLEASVVELEGGLVACAAFPLEPFEGLRSPTACDLLKRQHTGQAGCSAIDAQIARTDTDAVTKRRVLKRR